MLRRKKRLKKDTRPPSAHGNGETLTEVVEAYGEQYAIEYRRVGFDAVADLLLDMGLDKQARNIACAKRCIVSVNGEPVDWAQLDPTIGTRALTIGLKMMNEGPSKN